MGSDDDLVTREQIALRLQVPLADVDAWVADDAAAFPSPRGRARDLQMWGWPDVAGWASRRAAGTGASRIDPRPVREGARLFGREDDLAKIGAELAGRRHVVLTGPAGVGKTRLARELAHRCAGTFPDGVHVVELAPVREARLVDEVVAGVLGVAEQSQRGALGSVIHELRARRLLLVLDNCEHVAEACVALASALIDGCPDLSILATSQVRLEVSQGLEWPVAPLPVPDAAASVDAILASPSVALFCARATAVTAGFTAEGEAVRTVADICRQLDGIPLAIELAAARVVVLAPSELAERLDRRFLVLRSASSPDAGRHATLQMALDWSHDLLTDAERLLFRRLSVFLDPTDLSAVHAVCGQDGGEWNILDPLTGLIAKSLVQSDTSGIRARYRLLETVRLYAADRLDEAGEAAAIRRRHALWFVGLAEGAEPQLTGADQAAALRALAAHYSDLRGALSWSVAEGQAEIALRMAGALTVFWRIRGLFREGHQLLADALDIDAVVAPGVLAKALWGHGFIALMHDTRDHWEAGLLASHDHSRTSLERCLAIADKLEDRVAEARALLLLGNCAYAAGEGGRAKELLRRSASVAAEASDPWCWSHALGMEARVLIDDDDDLVGARQLVDRCLALGRQSRDLQGTRLGLILLGEIEVATGDYQAAAVAIEEGLEIGRRLGEPYMIQACLFLLAEIRARTGDQPAARELLDRAMVEDAHVSYRALLNLGELAIRQGDVAMAAQYFNQICTVLDADGKPPHAGLAGLGEVAAAEGRESDARALLTRARALAARRADRDRSIAALTASLGRLARDRGDRPRAVSLHCRALESFQETHCAPGVVQSIEDLGALRCDVGSPEHAARLLGAAQALRDQRGYARAPLLEARYDADVAAIRQALDGDRFREAWAEGASLSMPDAAAYALKGWGSRPRSASGWDSLTRAEREVVALVREGLTNRQIGERLFVSPRTVEGHLVHVYAKLGFRSRAKLAVDAGHQGA